jgi:DNA repair photolyase
MTDPYQPIEASSRKTREALESIYESHLDISILTKSALVTRDLDLFKQMKSVKIGFSISLDDDHAKIFEPRASLPSERIKALKTLHQAGIKTYVFISPIIPYITDVFNIIDEVKDDVDYLMFDTLNLKDLANKRRIFRLIETLKPDRLSDYQKIFDFKTSSYYSDLKIKIIDYIKTLEIPCHYLY